MLLRSITKHVRDQNWFAVALDFVIVVAGILIAFQITNWSEARRDRVDEADFMQDLHDDLIIASRQSARTESVRLQQAHELEKAAELMFGHSLDRELTTDECTAIAYSATMNVGRARLPSLIRLQGAGRTGIISDGTLSKDLAELTQRYEALDTVINEVVGVHIVLRHPELFPATTVMRPVTGSPDELERDASTTCSAEEILKNQAVINDITFNVDAYDAYMRDGLLPWVAQVRKVHERVDILLDISHDTEPSP